MTGQCQLEEGEEPEVDSNFPSLIHALVDKSLGMGKIEEAERYALALTNWLASVEIPVDHQAAVFAVDCLVTLAEKGSGGGAWLNRVFRIHATKGWIMAPNVVERARSVLDRIPRVPGTGLRDYEVRLRAMSREGRDVSAKLMAAVNEMLEVCTYGTMPRAGPASPGPPALRACSR